MTESSEMVDSSVDKPSTSYVITVLVFIFMVISFLGAIVLQLVVALLTSPLICCRWGRGLFQRIQSCVYRSTHAIVVVFLNPFWCVDLLELGEEGSDDACQTGMGSVIFVNHRSNADPWVVAWVQLLKCIEARYVYKGSLLKLPVLGWSLLLCGDLPAHFGDKERIGEMVEQAKDLLRSGSNIVVFPEGTRSPSGLLQDFKPKFFEICAELNCPARVLCLLGTERAWPQGGMKTGCARVTAVLSDPFLPDGIGTDALRQQVRDTMHELACHALDHGAVEDDDPFFTDSPYPWWVVPEELQSLTAEERNELLQSGKAHSRGKNLF